MREDHHTFEAHTESAADHFCDQCFGYHHWNASCPEDDSDGNWIDPEDEPDTAKADAQERIGNIWDAQDAQEAY